MTRTEAPEQTRDSEALASILDQVQRRLLAEINATDGRVTVAGATLNIEQLAPLNVHLHRGPQAATSAR